MECLEQAELGKQNTGVNKIQIAGLFRVRLVKIHKSLDKIKEAVESQKTWMALI